MLHKQWNLEDQIRFSKIIEENFKIIRNKVAKLEDDRVLKDDINTLITMVKNQVFIVN
jgi:histidine ammonia-lyase